MAKKGLLIIVSGPSGVGKGTIRAELMKDASLGLNFSVSMTTRSIRPGEKDGVDYFYVSKEEFQRNIDEGNFLEWAEFVDHRYGTPKAEVDRLRNLGKNVLLEIEVQGAKQVLSKVKDDDGVVSIFILPPSLKILEQRIRGRSTEPEDIILKRLGKARGEMGEKSNYKYNVINDRKIRCANEVKEILLKEINKNK